jgi:hypothetical protein
VLLLDREEALSAEAAKWAPIIKAAGIYAD